ncbi:unnamed protein product [Gordionus sp. m RMFG-2023]|uniref:uncharacterized protein LOC135926528 n=1 Tax=Gordionus sp. m RMFG-2023 TaxID=3053472 RepID=UPI0030E1ED49
MEDNRIHNIYDNSNINIIQNNRKNNYLYTSTQIPEQNQNLRYSSANYVQHSQNISSLDAYINSNQVKANILNESNKVMLKRELDQRFLNMMRYSIPENNFPSYYNLQPNYNFPTYIPYMCQIPNNYKFLNSDVTNGWQNGFDIGNIAYDNKYNSCVTSVINESSLDHYSYESISTPFDPNQISTPKISLPSQKLLKTNQSLHLPNHSTCAIATNNSICNDNCKGLRKKKKRSLEPEKSAESDRRLPIMNQKKASGWALHIHLAWLIHYHQEYSKINHLNPNLSQSNSHDNCTFKKLQKMVNESYNVSGLFGQPLPKTIFKENMNESNLTIGTVKKSSFTPISRNIV